MTAAGALLSEQSAHIRKGFELDCVARRIHKKHGGLLADFAFEARVGLNHKLGTNRFKFGRHHFPLRNRQHSTKVTDRNLMIVNSAGLLMTALVGGQMRHDLVPIKVKIHPIRRATAFATA